MRLRFLNNLNILVKVIDGVPSNPFLSFILRGKDLIIEPEDYVLTPAKFYLSDVNMLDAIDDVYFADEELAARLKQYGILLILHRRIITNNWFNLSSLNWINMEPQIALIIIIMNFFFLFVDFDSRYNVLEFKYLSWSIVILFNLAWYFYFSYAVTSIDIEESEWSIKPP